MSRRTDKADIVEYKPSKYQERIFDFIEHGSGNLLIEAAAGSGKTWTLVKSIELIPEDKSIIFLAFNRDIVVELKKKTRNVNNIDVRTLHSLGLKMLKESFPDEMLEAQSLKYLSYMRNNLRSLSSRPLGRMKKKTYMTYTDNIMKYVDYGRCYLCECVEDFMFIRERYGIEDVGDEIEVAVKILAWGMNNLHEVDYTDMVWLPNVLDIEAKTRYDFIMADECQDINKAERHLLLKCFKEGTRMVCVGDSNQAIYSFAGSDPASFNELKKLPGTTCLPLSISYRCARSIVSFANTIVPQMEPNGDGREGEVRHDVLLDEVRDGDMMICRNNSPLIQIYVRLLKEGKKAFVRGKDFGKQLISMVKSTEKEVLNVECKDDGVFARLYNDLFTLRNTIMSQNMVDEIDALRTSNVMNRLDAIKTLEYLSEDISTSSELIGKLERIFKSDDMEDGIALSTIHKAKGLEADRVFIIAPSLMPSKSAKKDWEVRQEMNLMYVAYTRAKNHLLFLSEDEIDDSDMTDDYNLTVLRMKERLVNIALSTTTKKVFTFDEAVDVLKKAKPIVLPSSSGNTVTLDGSKGCSSFGETWKKQVKKANRRKKIL